MTPLLPGTVDLQPAHLSRVRWRSRGYLPHLDGGALQQVMSWHLADSLPRDAAGRLAAAADDVEMRQRYEAYLDAGHGAFVLRDPVCAAIVQDALLHFDGERYRLLAWVVMPKHVHVLVELMAGHGLAGIMHSWKRHTALWINRHLGGNGPVWRREYWDRCIRDGRRFAAAVAYIHSNPVKAGLVQRPEDWAWSSAGFGPVGNRRSRGVG
jgi:REP element-mobilizing transposase RayT